MTMRDEPGVVAPYLWTPRILLTLAFCATVALVLLSPGLGLALAGEPTQAPNPSVRSSNSSDDPNLTCLKCHRDPSLSMTFPSGEVLSLYFDIETYRQSAHGDRLDCLDCHQRNKDYPHPSLAVYSRRDFAWAEYEPCQRCHFENYTRTLDSMHFDAMAQGDADAPVCTDCHTAHAVGRLQESRTRIAQTCSKCHDEIYQAYGRSVHGSALWEENPDVPDCTTCHGVHAIGGAATSSFRQASVELCAECHADKSLMDKYDISSNVVRTYLDDFHGKTVGFYQQQTSEVWPEVAVCTDCHGVHNIEPVDSPESSVVKENLVTTCRQCHPDATANFPSAWLSHYSPTMENAPLVFFVKQYYWVLIPMMVVGLALNVVLDLWRLARNR